MFNTQTLEIMEKIEVKVHYQDVEGIKVGVFTDEFDSDISAYPDAVLELAGVLPASSKYPLVDSVEITLADNNDRGAIIKCDKRNGIITIYPKYWEDVEEYKMELKYEDNTPLMYKISTINSTIYDAIYKPSDRQISLHKACLEILGDDAL